MPDRYIVPSIDRAFHVLNLLAQHGSLGLSDLVKLSSIPKTSLYRILSTLEQRRAVISNGQGEFRLGSKMLELSSHYLDGFEFHREAYEPMRELATSCGETVFLAHLEEGEVIYTRRVESPQSVTAVRKLGNRAPAHCTATGVAMLAFLPHPEVNKLLDAHGLEAFNESTVTDRVSFYERLEQVRNTGIAVVDGEYEQELLCISAPVLDHLKHPRAAITVALLSHSNPSSEKITETAKLVKEAGAKLSRLSGYSSIASQGGSNNQQETQESTSSGGRLMKRVVNTSARLALLLCLMVMIPGLALAQTGKVAGVVSDADSGQPLPGATVSVDGTTLGTVSDSQGRYTIIGITPGSYDVRFQFVGYTPSVIRGVRVTSDRTTTLNGTLTSDVVQAGEVVVEDVRPVVDPNQTVSRSLVSGEEIARLPVTDLADVVGTTANSYAGYIRGSRRFETKTVVEGIDISDSFYSLSEGDNYNGSLYSSANRANETSASILSLNPGAVEEVAVNSAAGAQYSGSSGGVVAITLAENKGPISGSFSFRTTPSNSRPGPDSLDFYTDLSAFADDRASVSEALAGDPTNEGLIAKLALYDRFEDGKYAFGDDPEYDIRGNVGGSITDKWSFGLSGQFFQSHGYMPNQFSRRINGQLKTSYDVSNKTKVTAVAIIDDQGRWGNWNNTNYMEFWRFYLEGVAQNDAGSYVGSVKLTQIIDDKSFLTFQAYATSNQTRIGYVDDNGNGVTDLGEDGDFLDFTDPDVASRYIENPSDRDNANPKMFTTQISDAFGDSGLFLPNNTRYRLAQPSPFAEEKTANTKAFKVDYVNQVNFNHFVQAGIDFKLRNFDFFSANGSDGLGFILNDAVEPFRVTDWDRSPWELGIYVSDRIEYAGLKVNAGLRVELIDRDTEKINDYFYPFVQDSISVAGNTLFRNFFNRGESVPVDVLWNPSIGISHPIGSTASMYFSFNHSEQLTPYNELYRNYDGNHSTNRFIPYNDPEQDPIISNNFELGIQWEVSEGWGLDVNAYARAIDNYGAANITLTNNNPDGSTTVPGLTTHTFRTDFGYADSRGIEAVVRRRPTLIAKDVTLGLTASYTFSTVETALATGINPTSQVFDAAGYTACTDAGGTPEACRADFNQVAFDDTDDFQNFPQSVRGGSTIAGGFDRRHRGIVRAVSGLPYDFSVGLQAKVESGFLYPKAVDVDPRDRELLTGPTNHTIDLRLEKRFNIPNMRYGIDLYVDVINLFNKDNVVAYDNNAQTGADVIFQQTGVPGKTLIDADGFSYYGPSRTVYFGTRVRF
ncbi:MAG: helix-turn-helix domain-containing protein [Rhodothermales bacterium]|nr:helix-turn-helix domain-containing protein [Rhodothermales bacterium]